MITAFSDSAMHLAARRNGYRFLKKYQFKFLKHELHLQLTECGDEVELINWLREAALHTSNMTSCESEKQRL